MPAPSIAQTSARSIPNLCIPQKDSNSSGDPKDSPTQSAMSANPTSPSFSIDEKDPVQYLILSGQIL
ncbi:hypothetical protein HDU97_004323 [Phlyctochytrium planicorne]|nr:hypothetical protein HDU97_004323 [Phlyctochytrium planicorne]